MKTKILIMMLVSMSFVLLAQAQNDTIRLTPEQKAKKQTESMVKKYNLTQDQGTKVYQINLKEAQKKEALHIEAQKQKAARDQQKKEIASQKDADMKAVLSEDQYKLYLMHKEEMALKKKMKEAEKKPAGQ